METIAENIREVINNSREELLKIDEETASAKPSISSWSKKEILGHLIDSASNNHQRIVRAAQNIALDFPTYNQNKWVDIQQYNLCEWQNLINLFYLYNLHISHIISSLQPESLNNLINIGKDQPVTLEFVVTDYLRHLKHHIEKILTQKI